MKRIPLAITSLAILGAGVLGSSPAAGEFDPSALIAQVQNHEARISNVENDVKALQETTSTPPAAHIEVPVAQAVSQPVAAPAPVPAPVSVAPAAPEPIAPIPTPENREVIYIVQPAQPATN